MRVETENNKSKKLNEQHVVSLLKGLPNGEPNWEPTCDSCTCVRECACGGNSSIIRFLSSARRSNHQQDREVTKTIESLKRTWHKGHGR